MTLSEYISLVMGKLDTLSPSVDFTVGLDERGNVNMNSTTTVSFTVQSRPRKPRDPSLKDMQEGLSASNVA